MGNAERLVRCTKCGHVGPESEFPKDRDFFQNRFICACPTNCGNRQSPGGASMRGFGGERPFVYVERQPEPIDALGATLHRSEEAS